MPPKSADLYPRNGAETGIREEVRLKNDPRRVRLSLEIELIIWRMRHAAWIRPSRLPCELATDRPSPNSAQTIVGLPSAAAPRPSAPGPRTLRPPGVATSRRPPATLLEEQRDRARRFCLLDTQGPPPLAAETISMAHSAPFSVDHLHVAVPFGEARRPPCQFSFAPHICSNWPCWLFHQSRA